ncbi:indole-3-glycerol phosphate synthase-domain-containing protein [Crucibulum laeve]|uniref:Multifunctional tryptophan biosynthesis protein n=1 Tax=Crucibulum laeve TaxID=68775 RepID=A0A5C3LUZ6_9AGAR|nr:indole-3-glycerol phosphate synthase-domain-containing protein [Crucibulum laeve]
MSTSEKKPTILETIYAQRAKDVEVAKSTPGTTPEDLSTLLQMNLAPPLIQVVPRLKRNPSTSSSSSSPSLMAEIKRASPSKGPIAMTTNVAQQALTYALSGASVISVLTEPTWFKGSLFDMRLVRQAIDALPDRPAVLRKEFILDEYQIMEARLWGADTVLLIVAMLSQERLETLYHYSLSLGMEPLVEVNNADEMRRALGLGSKMIGVNNRNLHNFEVDMGTTSRLVEMVKERDLVLCALSGIKGPEDVRVYKEEGVKAVLVGEALMRAEDTGKFIRELLDWPEIKTQGEGEKNRERTWVKVTGVRSESEAISLTETGTDILSFVFDPQEKTYVKPEEAAPISSKIRAARLSPSASAAVSPYLRSTPWFTAQLGTLTATYARPLLVGVFNKQPLAYIQHTVAISQLDLVQLNGDEPSGWTAHIPVPVIRQFTVAKNESPSQEITRPGVHSFCLLDVQGGREAVGELQRVVEKGEVPGWRMPVILRASGIEEEALVDIIRSLDPWAVDLDLEIGVLDVVKRVKGL